MSRRSGPKVLPARPTEAIDAASGKIRQTIASPFLARPAGMVWRRCVRTLSARKRQARCRATHAQRGRVLRRADQPPLFAAQPLLLTVLAFPQLNGLEFPASTQPTYFLPDGGTDGSRHG